ncbi:MAG: hypothetical protein AAF548_19935 [Actinomycetota bacterium]
MHPLWLVVALVVFGVAAPRASSDRGAEPTVGPVPEVVGRALTADDLPDLIPLVDDAGALVGYLRADEVFVELFHPERAFTAPGVYERDGVTLVGHEVPGRGFVASTPSATPRPGVAPDDLPAPIPSE